MPIPDVLNNPITQKFVAILFAVFVIAFLIPFLPIVPFPEEITTAFSFLMTNLWKFDFIFPVQTMIILFGLWFLMEATFITIRIVMFFWSLVQKI